MKFAIWTGAAWEDWAPASVDEGGIGGSETAAVMVSRELAKLGHRVELYGQFKEGVDGCIVAYEGGGGVLHTHYKNVVDPGQISGDVFVSSRDVHALLLQPQARAKAVWVHDINLGHDTHDRLDKYNTIMCLSDWSRNTMEAYYPHIRKNRIFVTRNGIDVTRFKPEMSAEEVLQKKSWPPRFTYSSSPDRGLDKLLDLWPKIREFAPGGELHVYYGFKNWKLMAKGNSVAVSKIAWFERRLHEMEGQGVVFHGRVGQQELADSYMKSLLWLYPTDFKETSCITAMEAQAAACVPVCTGLAALNETVKYGVKIKPFAMEARYETDFLGEVKRLIEDAEKRNAMAVCGRVQALQDLSWADVAQQWVEHFTKVIAAKELSDG